MKAPGAAVEAQPIPILVVDDYAPIRRGVARILVAHGYAPRLASSLDEARHALEVADNVAPFALVVLDLNFGDGGVDGAGEDLLPFIHALGNPPKVVVLTSSVDPQRNLRVGPRVHGAVHKLADLQHDLPAEIDRILRIQATPALPSPPAVPKGLPILRGKVGRSPALGSPILPFARMYDLTTTEARVVHERAVSGCSDKETAALIGCSEAAVRVHWNGIYKKSGLRSRTAVVAYAWKLNVSLG